jgi:hypothetical protein
MMTVDTQQADFLAKILAINMWSAGASQTAIARAVGKSKSWVNSLLKGVPKPKSS